MARQPKFRIYLAGPITGCNEMQRTEWRNAVKKKFGNKMEFIDPVDNLIDGSVSAYKVVEADLEAIETSDGILVNMWRESVGSAIGVVHAHQHGKPVAVADPNHLRSSVLEFYADVVTDNPLKAVGALKDILSTEAWTVLKAGGRVEEPFNRSKLTRAIRGACSDAGCDEFGLPRMVLQKAVDSLRIRMKSGDWRHPKNEIPSRLILDVVDAALNEISQDVPAAAKVRDKYKTPDRPKASPEGRFGRKGPAPVSTEPGSPNIFPGDVIVQSSGSHATVWGKSIEQLHDIPSNRVRNVFTAIWQVSGVTEIVLGRFGRGNPRKKCAAKLSMSKNNSMIEGVVYDRGPKGTYQTFRVRVQYDSQKHELRQKMEKKLRDQDLWFEA